MSPAGPRYPAAFRRARRACVALALALAATGCAPDAMNNLQATGFNAFLGSLARQCNPLVIGNGNVGEWLQQQGNASPNYTYFLDMTSKLYYGTISARAYREGITSNDRSFDCIFQTFSAQRATTATR
jgi:hypothetical protein